MVDFVFFHLITFTPWGTLKMRASNIPAICRVGSVSFVVMVLFAAFALRLDTFSVICCMHYCWHHCVVAVIIESILKEEAR